MQAQEAVPVFRLYGETEIWPTPDLMHIESVAERSRLHDWHILPHQHADLAQVLYLREGRAEIEIEGRLSVLERPAVQVIPMFCVHGFRFAENVQGYVLSVALPLLEQVEKRLECQVLRSPDCYVLDETEAMYLDSRFDQLGQEYAGRRIGRDLVLSSLVDQILVWGCRRHHDQVRTGQEMDRGRRHMDVFLHLVETNFNEQWPVDAYAERMGVSTPHLNAVCRRLCHHSALQVIHQRVLLEAKRGLIYTTMSVSQISDRLGFSEPAYFSRFFKRLTGTSPREFRNKDVRRVEQ
ncbi:helix-turn-helix domain-containing protein [Marinobacter sp. DUT-3]|uniref:helix-turn-helix domain-containing protein n=1 Tax=Marinobacter sp. DUT-3 TaxID=3412036 RepID=UPI003D182AF5